MSQLKKIKTDGENKLEKNGQFFQDVIRPSPILRSGEPETENAASKSLDAVDDEEFVCLATLKQMLTVQESMLKSVFDSVISSEMTRVDELMKTVTLLKRMLKGLQRWHPNSKTLRVK